MLLHRPFSGFGQYYIIMASRAHLPFPISPRFGEGDLARRIALASEQVDDCPAAPSLRRRLGEFTYLAEPIVRKFRQIDIPATQNPQIVMVLPGFFTGPTRMRYLAKMLEQAGHKSKDWGQGLNLGPTRENISDLEQRLIEVHERYGQKVVLLGWSLGGLFARELAKLQPDAVSKVITMGTPFSGSPRANNAWRLYQLVAGHSVDEPPIEGDRREKPPVETVAFWSPRDGVIAPRSACGHAGERDRAIALRCTHMGFSYAPEAIHEVLRELDRA